MSRVKVSIDEKIFFFFRIIYQRALLLLTAALTSFQSGCGNQILHQTLIEILPSGAPERWAMQCFSPCFFVGTQNGTTVARRTTSKYYIG